MISPGVKKFVPALLITLAVCITYAPAVRDGFVWDDTALILRDPLIRSWRLIPEGFQHFLFTDATASDFYRPIQRLTYTLEYWAFGAHAAPYHVTSVLCQIAAALALLAAARELLRSLGLPEDSTRWAAFAATLVWAIHPIQSAAVVYVSGRADSLAAVFGFSGLCCALRAFRGGARAKWTLGCVAVVLFLCSALSKEAGLLFPLFWCAVALLRRVRGMVGASTATALAVGLIYASLRFSAEHVAPPLARHPMPLLVRPVLAARAVAEYACLIAFPWHLYMDRDVETHPTGFSDSSITGAAQRELQTVAGVLVLAILVYWLIRSRKRDLAVFVCLVLAAIAYLPCSGLVGLNATVAEHWMYLPSSFLFLAAAIALTKLLRDPRGRSRFFVRGVAAIVPIWILFLGARTYLRTFDWRDQRTFFEHTIAAGGDSARMHINLAGVELNDGHFKEAKDQLQEALRKAPDEPLAVLNLATVAIKENDFRRAHELLARAIEIPAVSAEAQELTAVLANKETGAVDLMGLRLASRTGAPNWSIEKRYIKVLAESGQVDCAIAETQACLKTQWYRAESWQLLSQLLASAGRKQDAVRAYAQAEALDVHLGDRPKVL